jgi:hypothetical protein
VARKKLSASQRTAIRKEILKKLGAGASRTAVSRDLSKKYGVSTVTIRWYIKSLKGTSAAPRTAPVSIAAPIRAMKLLDIVKNVSEEGLARALAAKKLFVQLQRKLEETERLRRTEREVQRSLQHLTASARQLEKKLYKLTVR